MKIENPLYRNLSKIVKVYIKIALAWPFCRCRTHTWDSWEVIAESTSTNCDHQYALQVSKSKRSFRSFRRIAKMNFVSVNFWPILKPPKTRICIISTPKIDAHFFLTPTKVFFFKHKKMAARLNAPYTEARDREKNKVWSFVFFEKTGS